MLAIQKGFILVTVLLYLTMMLLLMSVMFTHVGQQLRLLQRQNYYQNLYYQLQNVLIMAEKDLITHKNIKLLPENLSSDTINSWKHYGYRRKLNGFKIEYLYQIYFREPCGKLPQVNFYGMIIIKIFVRAEEFHELNISTLMAIPKKSNVVCNKKISIS